MKRARIGRVVAIAAIGALFGAIQLQFAERAVAQTPIKKVMGDNLGAVQSILQGLISANYSMVPAQAEVIHKHAQELPGLIPDSAKAEREKFLAFAGNLGAHASDIKAISETLMQHDKARGESSTDYLREALASHYGGMVTMCVSCHNLFRPLPTP
jgi:cytochrome c556